MKLAARMEPVTAHRHMTSMKQKAPTNLLQKVALCDKKPVRTPDSGSKKVRTVYEEAKKILGRKEEVKPQENKLTEEEQQIYGNRFPGGYEKISLLGKYMWS